MSVPIYEMKKVKVDYFAGNVVCLHPVTDYAGIRKMNENALILEKSYSVKHPKLPNKRPLSCIS